MNQDLVSEICEPFVSEFVYEILLYALLNLYLKFEPKTLYGMVLFK